MYTSTVESGLSVIQAQIHSTSCAKSRLPDFYGYLFPLAGMTLEKRYLFPKSGNDTIKILYVPKFGNDITDSHLTVNAIAHVSDSDKFNSISNAKEIL